MLGEVSPMQRSGSYVNTPKRRTSTSSEERSGKDSSASSPGRLSTGAVRRVSGAGFNFDAKAVVQQNETVCKERENEVLKTPLRQRSDSEETTSSEGTHAPRRQSDEPATSAVTSYDTAYTGGSVSPPLSGRALPSSLAATAEEVTPHQNSEPEVSVGTEVEAQLPPVVSSEQKIEAGRRGTIVAIHADNTVEVKWRPSADSEATKVTNVHKTFIRAIQDQSVQALAVTAEEQVQCWTADYAFSLGRSVENSDACAVQRLDASQHFSVSQTLEALNRGRATCAGGMCIVWSESQDEYFLLLRRDKIDEGIRVAREAFGVVVGNEDSSTQALAQPSSELPLADDPSAPLLQSEELLFSKEVKTPSASKPDVNQTQDAGENGSGARVSKRLQCRTFLRSVGGRARRCFTGGEA